jgi:hypothetical protein
MDKQLFAKIGVFLLLGLNVGAYYVFWPSHNGASKSEAKAPKEEKGEVELLPTRPKSAQPKELPASSLADAIPLSIPSAPKMSERGASADDAVSKLLNHIKKETEAANEVAAPPMPRFFDEKKDVFPEKQEGPAKKGGFPAFPDDNKPKPLPLLKADPLILDPNIGVTSALTPKVAPSPWLLNMESVGNQTLLIAKLRQPATGGQVAEFRILCDRVETKAPGGGVQAVGKVTFAGAGMKGACQRMTIPIQETRLLFEEEVSIVQDLNAGASLRGDRFIWELATEPKMPSLGGPR